MVEQLIDTTTTAAATKELNYRQKLFKTGVNGVFGNVLNMFRKTELLSMRLICDKLATQIPCVFKKLEYYCEDEQPEAKENGFLTLVTKPDKLTIHFIDGSESHFKQVETLLNHITSKLTYLFLKFYIDSDEDKDPKKRQNEKLAQQYVELFAKSEALQNLKTFKFEIYGNSNFGHIFRLMSKQKATLNWFSTVETIKVYNVQMKDVTPIYDFLLSFGEKFVQLKGRTGTDFDPLKPFSETRRRIPKLSWCVSMDNQGLRDQVVNFLEFNQTRDLKMQGGSLDQIEIQSLGLANDTKHLRLHQMPSVDLTRVFHTIPHGLETLHLFGLDKLTLEDF